MDAATEPDNRLAELLAALALGIDLAFGQPLEPVLRQCRIAIRLCELAGVDEDTHATSDYSAPVEYETIMTAAAHPRPRD